MKINEDNIRDIINNTLTLRDNEKKKYGEVYTPTFLIDEIYDNLPTEVFMNPHFKWLDPCVGTGNFTALLYFRLMNTLTMIPKNKRSSHILKNMIYMNELNPDNVKKTKALFNKIHPRIKINIIEGDFLTCEYDTKFDIIVGNPPYNKERTSKKGTSAGRVPLWDKFIYKSMDLLADSGFLCFINPPLYRGTTKPRGEIWRQHFRYKLRYLHIYGMKDGMKIFKCGTRFDVYIICNKPSNELPIIIDELGVKHRLNVSLLPFLPNYAFDIFNEIMDYNMKDDRVLFNSYYHTHATDKPRLDIKDIQKGTEKCVLIKDKVCHHSSKVKKSPEGAFIHPVVHSINKDGVICRYTDEGNTRAFGIPKVILNKNQRQYNYPEQNDYVGKYGITELSFGIKIDSKEEGDEILKALDTDTFKTMIKGSKWGIFQTDCRMFSYFDKDWYKTILNYNKPPVELVGGCDDNIPRVKDLKIGDYKYPLFHSILKKGIKYKYTNDKERGFFGVPKVILAFNGTQYNHPEQNDYEGKYGMTQMCFGIKIDSKEEGDAILKAIGTEKFKKMIKGSKWGIYQTDYRMFKSFKKGWWNDFME